MAFTQTVDVTATTNERRWMGPARLLLRTRRARRMGDAGAALRAVARGAETAVGIRIRGQHIVLLLDPGLAGELLATHAKQTVKGPGVQLTRPLLGNGLLTSEGDDHTRARRLVAPAFSPRRLAGYVDTFAHCASAHTDTWLDGDQLDIHRELAALTLNIVGQTLLGIDLADEAPTVRTGLEAALNTFGSNTTTGFAAPSLRRRPSLVVDGAAILPVHRLIDEIIEKRREEPSSDRGDVVSALLTASDGPDGLTSNEVHDHVITLLMAGHETTANALSFTLHLLGRHPAVQQRLHDELDALDGRPPTFADLPTLTYARAVISEAMRLYPPAWIIGRSTTADLDLGGFHLPSGSVVAVSPLLMHHDPRWFADPETFDPQRWLDGRNDALPRYAYLPFGTGPRSCIGEQFAWAEAVTVLAVLAQRWRVETNTAEPVRVQYRVTLRPEGELPVTVHARTDSR